MAITEARSRLGLRCDSHHRAAGDEDEQEYVLNGEKIFVTSGDRGGPDRRVGRRSTRARARAAIKSFVVEREQTRG